MSFGEIRVNLSNTSPMDLVAFGLLKRGLQKWHSKTLNGHWKKAQEDWSKNDTAVLRKSLFP